MSLQSSDGDMNTTSREEGGITVTVDTQRAATNDIKQTTAHTLQIAADMADSMKARRDQGEGQCSHPADNSGHFTSTPSSLSRMVAEVRPYPQCATAQCAARQENGKLGVDCADCCADSDGETALVTGPSHIYKGIEGDIADHEVHTCDRHFSGGRGQGGEQSGKGGEVIGGSGGGRGEQMCGDEGECMGVTSREDDLSANKGFSIDTDNGASGKKTSGSDGGGVTINDGSIHYTCVPTSCLLTCAPSQQVTTDSSTEGSPAVAHSENDSNTAQNGHHDDADSNMAQNGHHDADSNMALNDTDSGDMSNEHHDLSVSHCSQNDNDSAMTHSQHPSESAETSEQQHDLSGPHRRHQMARQQRRQEANTLTQPARRLTLPASLMSRWRAVGRQWGVQDDDDIACILTRHYEDMMAGRPPRPPPRPRCEGCGEVLVPLPCETCGPNRHSVRLSHDLGQGGDKGGKGGFCGRCRD